MKSKNKIVRGTFPLTLSGSTVAIRICKPPNQYCVLERNIALGCEDRQRYYGRYAELTVHRKPRVSVERRFNISRPLIVTRQASYRTHVDRDGFADRSFLRGARLLRERRDRGAPPSGKQQQLTANVTATAVARARTRGAASCRISDRCRRRDRRRRRRHGFHEIERRIRSTTGMSRLFTRVSLHQPRKERRSQSTPVDIERGRGGQSPYIPLVCIFRLCYRCRSLARGTIIPIPSISMTHYVGPRDLF